MDILEYEVKDLTEKELELKIMKYPHLIEPGLHFVASQRRAGRGPLDLLLLDSGNALVVLELKVHKDDEMLFQGLDYYDYVYSNLERLALAYKAMGLKIDPSQELRLMLIAPDFSQSLMNRCKWLRLKIDLFRYRALTVRKGDDIVGELIDFLYVETPSIPEREEVYTPKRHVDYITDPELRKVAKDFFEKVNEWEAVRLDAIKYAISMKVGKDVFAYFYPLRGGFNVAGYLTGREWQALATVKSFDDLEEAILATKKAYENIKEK